MRSWIVSAGLVVLCGSARGEDRQGPVPGALPVPPARRIMKTPADAVVLELNAEGGIRRGGEGVTLDMLKNYFENARGEAAKSDTVVLVKADRDAPWMHVSWLLMACAEGKFPKVEFVARRAAAADMTEDEAKELGAERRNLPADQIPEARLPAHLPEDAGAGRQEIVVSVHVVARKEAEAEWQGGAVMKPTEFRYRFNERESTSLDDVRTWIRDARKAIARAPAEGVAVVGEIKAGQKVPFGRLAAVLGAFHAEGLKEVRFYGTAAPTDVEKKRTSLPYPKVNYGTG